MNDALTAAVNAADLPALIAKYYPESGAKPGKQDLIFASWRGNERTPAFSVYKHNGVWLYSDKATDETGNAYTFLTSIVGLAPEEAMLELGVTPEAPHPPTARPTKRPEIPTATPEPLGEIDRSNFMLKLERGKQRPESLRGRGFRPEELDELMVLDDGGDAIIPIFTPDGELAQAKRRLLKPGKGGKYRYEFSGHPAVPWVSPNIATAPYILIVEGELNAAVAYFALRGDEEYRHFGVMGVAGAQNRLYAELLEDRTVYVYSDNDTAGYKARESWVSIARSKNARACYVLESQPEDFCDLAGKNRKGFEATLKDLLRAAEPAFTVLDRRFGSYTIKELREAAKRYIDGHITHPTGFKELDRITGGIPEADISLIGALPGMGKSAFLRHVLLTHLQQSRSNRVLLFSPDQSVPSICRLMATRVSGVSASSLREGKLTNRMKERYGDMQTARKAWVEAFDNFLLHYGTRFLMSEAQELEAVKLEISEAMERGVTMVGFDYLQLFHGDEGRGVDTASKAMHAFKAGATTLWRVPLLFAAQLAKYKFTNSRNSGFPMVSDIEGRGIYHQVANQILLLYNQDKYLTMFNLDPDEYADYHYQDTGKARVSVAKNKEGDDGRWVYLRWDAETVTFYDV